MIERDKKPNITEFCPMDYEPCDKREEIFDEYSTAKIFLDIPYSDYPKGNQIAIEDTIKKYDLIPVLAERSRRTKSLYCNVCKNIHKCDMAIIDITGQNPNVLIELGIIQRNQMKYCILCKKEADIPLDLRGFTIDKYTNKSDIKKKVSKWITDNVEEITIRIAKQRKIFDVISYELEQKSFSGIDRKIHEVRAMGEITPLINEYYQVIDRLIDFLKDDDAIVRLRAARTLRVIGDTKAVEPLIEALKDEDWGVRKNAIEAFIIFDNTRAVEPLIEALRDENSEVRRRAAAVLGRFGDVRAIEPLKALLNFNNEYDWIKDIAKLSIKRIESAQKEKNKE